jgi:predicted nucleic acid-binding protein
MRVVLDSSGWIELLAGSDRAALFEPALHAEELLIPAIVRYEVGRYVLAHKGEAGREMALSALSKFDLVPIDAVVADSAAELAHNHKLAMADTLVYAVAKIANAELWTQDRHFENLNGVRYFRKG